MSFNIETLIAFFSPTIWAKMLVWAMLAMSPMCGLILAGDHSGSLPSRYQIHGAYIPKNYAGLAVVSDMFCHDLGSDGDIARLWIREHAIDPEVLHNGREEVGRSSECKVRSLGFVLGLRITPVPRGLCI